MTSDEVEARIMALGGIHPLVSDEFLPIEREQIRALEEQLYIVLPFEYVYLLTQYGGFQWNEIVSCSAIPYKHSDRDRVVSLLVDSFYTMQNSELSNNLDWNIEIFRDRMPKSLIPIGDDGGGNQVCLGISGDEILKVFSFDHDNESPDNENPDEWWENIYLMADSFDEFLTKLVIR